MEERANLARRGRQLEYFTIATADRWINPAAFAAPPALAFGNVGRNTVVGPGMQTLDLALTREFNITEKTKFQFRAEFFNALNHTNLGTPGRFVNTPQFGVITEAATPYDSLGNSILNLLF